MDEVRRALTNEEREQQDPGRVTVEVIGAAEFVTREKLPNIRYIDKRKIKEEMEKINEVI